MSKKILIAYASVSGSTGQVAEAIGEVVAQAGVKVQVSAVKDVDQASGYSAVVLGSSIRAGRWLPEAVNFLEKNRDILSQMPVAYFTTCLTMVDDTEDSRRTVMAYMEPVLQAAPEIEPVGLGLFAGSLDPQRQLFMQTRLGPQGDYRDWDAIRRWAEEIRPALLEGAARSAQAMILREAVLRYTDMAGADLSRADLREADLSESDLHGANLSETDLAQAKLHRTDLYQARLQKAGLNWADLHQADLSDADLSQANLMGANLHQADLSQADLSRALLNGANLSRANLSGADLRQADLNWADLSGADLSGADLSGASLGWANLSRANLSGANLTNARYNNQTAWPETFSAKTAGGIFFEVE